METKYFDSIEDAKTYLVNEIGIDYERYINTRLAGDFSFEIANKLQSAQEEIEKLNAERKSALSFMNSNAQVVSDQGYVIDRLETKLTRAVDLLEDVLEDTLAPDIDNFLESLK